jgi:hypothetical protein
MPEQAMTQTGHVTFDDRNHAVWKWSEPQQLEAAELSLADSGLRTARESSGHVESALKGYDPYESGLPANGGGVRRPRRDLHRLDEWIRLKKQVERIRQED